MADHSDLDLEDERHARRVMLMRMQAETDRMERRVYICYAVAGALAVVAIVLGISL